MLHGMMTTSEPAVPVDSMFCGPSNSSFVEASGADLAISVVSLAGIKVADFVHLTADDKVLELLKRLAKATDTPLGSHKLLNDSEALHCSMTLREAQIVNGTVLTAATGDLPAIHREAMEGYIDRVHAGLVKHVREMELRLEANPTYFEREAEKFQEKTRAKQEELLVKQNELVAMHLPAIWDAFDVDGDGVLSTEECMMLVREHVAVCRDKQPENCGNLERPVIPLCKDVMLKMFDGAKLPQIIEIVFASHRCDPFSKYRSEGAKFLDSVDREDIARKLLAKMGKNNDGTVTRDEFLEGYIQGITQAIMESSLDLLSPKEVPLMVTRYQRLQEEQRRRRQIEHAREKLLQRWLQNVHPRARQAYPHQKELVGLLNHVINGIKFACTDPVLDSTGTKCVFWYSQEGGEKSGNEKASQDRHATMRVAKPGGESKTISVTRFLVFTFADDESFQQIAKLPPNTPFLMSCKNQLCVNLAHVRTAVWGEADTSGGYPSVDNCADSYAPSPKAKVTSRSAGPAGRTSSGRGKSPVPAIKKSEFDSNYLPLKIAKGKTGARHPSRSSRGHDGASALSPQTDGKKAWRSHSPLPVAKKLTAPQPDADARGPRRSSSRRPGTLKIPHPRKHDAENRFDENPNSEAPPRAPRGHPCEQTASPRPNFIAEHFPRPRFQTSDTPTSSRLKASQVRSTGVAEIERRYNWPAREDSSDDW